MNPLFTKGDSWAVCPEATEAARIAEERLTVIKGKGTPQQVNVTFQEREQALGFEIELSKSWDIVIRASRKRDYIAGVGRMLELLLQAANSSDNVLVSPTGKWEHIPQHPVRVHYMPAHFGNSFEIGSSSEMQRYLEDLALAGASGYGDWFDPNDMPDPYNRHVVYGLSTMLWRRKKEWLVYSQQLGLDNVLILTPNVGFVDQMRPEWIGVRSSEKHVTGQVLCPSNPAAREVIKKNQQNLFTDLKNSGIDITKVVCFPYDDGGCACEKCQPYYPIFLGLVHDMYNTISPLYPAIKVDISGWWTSDEESQQLQSFIAGTAKDWFGSFQFSATYGVFALPDIRSQIGDMSLGSFLHIAFSNDRRDVYMATGIHVAATRVQSVIRSFAGQHCQGFMSYNESFADHYNAFVTSQLGWDPDKDVRQITTFYCALILGVHGNALQQLVDVLLDMEMLEEEKAAGWADTLRKLKHEVNPHENQPWAFEHILSKAELMALDYKINQRLPDNVEDALADMEARFALNERLMRQGYGFGVVRRFSSRMLPPWHKVYVELTGKRKFEFQSTPLSHKE